MISRYLLDDWSFATETSERDAATDAIDAELATLAESARERGRIHERAMIRSWLVANGHEMAAVALALDYVPPPWDERNDLVGGTR